MNANLPAWVPDAVFYQIFPDRFARSSSASKPANLQPWGDPPTQEKFQGGDLPGIVERLDYLADLGVNALYLNPIFQSAANHRYHTHDYYQVDPILGGNEALRLLVREVHARGMRIILDGVFNHASRGFFQFHDILENGPDSPWLDWFHVRGWPVSAYDGAQPANYDSWAGNRALPKFNTYNPQVRDFLMDVASHWIKAYDIDGWRLDVPEDILTPGFWETFRRRVKQVKPDAYLVGEVWHEAREWLRGDRFDAVMNYPFAAAVIAFVMGARVSPSLVEGRSYDPYPPIDAAGFGARIRRQMSLYEWPIIQTQFNQLASHDTARLISLARGDTNSVRLSTFLQMTLPGAPCIYYGDEIGLRGTEAYDEPYHDADARWAFPWHDASLWHTGLLTEFQKLIALRHRYTSLRRGGFRELFAEGQCYVFARETAGQPAMLAAVNVGDGEVSVSLSTADWPDTVATPTICYGRMTSLVREGQQLALTIPTREALLLEMA